jgi:hypothetical protein
LLPFSRGVSLFSFAAGWERAGRISSSWWDWRLDIKVRKLRAIPVVRISDVLEQKEKRKKKN